MTDPKTPEAVGRWRITGSDTWDREFLDLVNPARFTLDDNGRGTIEFGAVHLDLTVADSQQLLFFRFAGFDEGDEVSGDGIAEIADDDTLEIQLRFLNGDRASLFAQREGSSASV